MDKVDFLNNLRTARNLFAHRVETDDAKLDPAVAEREFRRAAIWLTPVAVRGFNSKDFPELPADARRSLEEAVDRFRRAATDAASSQQLSSEQIREGMDALADILRVLQPYFEPRIATERRIREIVERVALPDSVLTWDLELGDDSSGEPAVWLWFYFDDEAVAREDWYPLTREVESRVRDALSAEGIPRWPYFRFRAAADQWAL